MKKTIKTLLITAIISAIAIAAACSGGGTASEGKAIAEKKISDNLTVSIMNADGKLKMGKQEVTLKFTDGKGAPAEMTAASLNFMMPAMGSMSEMNSSATLTTSGNPGEFAASVDIEMAGEWQAQIGYEGKETGKTTISVTAQ